VELPEMAVEDSFQQGQQNGRAVAQAALDLRVYVLLKIGDALLQVVGVADFVRAERRTPHQINATSYFPGAL